jgi:hypothetical protein
VGRFCCSAGPAHHTLCRGGAMMSLGAVNCEPLLLLRFTTINSRLPSLTASNNLL